MGISRLNLAELKFSAQLAARTQWRGLDSLRLDTRKLHVRPLPRQAPAVQTLGVVAADAGLVSVELTPFSLEFLYVADSRHHVHLAEIFPLTTIAENLREIFGRVPVLQRFAQRLQLNWEDLSQLWAKEVDRGQLFPQDVRLVADTLRELAEWAVCSELAETETVHDGIRPGLLILHDGLLRSVLLRHNVISERLPGWWREQWETRGVSMAGVGKTSMLWQRLALVLDLDPRVQALPDCYIAIPQDIESVLTGRRPDARRLGFGRLVLLKTSMHPSGVYLPVDLPEWILEDSNATEAVLGAISHSSQTAFPRPGYPAPLGEAHEAAHLTEFDARVIRDQVIRALREMVPEEEFERLLRAWAFQPAKWDKTGSIGKT